MTERGWIVLKPPHTLDASRACLGTVRPKRAHAIASIVQWMPGKKWADLHAAGYRCVRCSIRWRPPKRVRVTDVFERMIYDLPPPKRPRAPRPVNRGGRR